MYLILCRDGEDEVMFLPLPIYMLSTRIHIIASQIILERGFNNSDIYVLFIDVLSGMILLNLPLLQSLF